jgi:hypothetical protein
MFADLGHFNYMAIQVGENIFSFFVANFAYAILVYGLIDLRKRSFKCEIFFTYA